MRSPDASLIAVVAALVLGAVLLEPRVQGARRLGGAVLVAILAYTGVYAWSTTARYAQDTRTQAAAELPDLVPEGATLAWYGGLPNYYPRVSASRYELRTCDNPGPGAATGCGADFVLLSGMTIWRPYRGPMIYHEAYENFEALRGGETGYELVRVWRSGYLNQELYARLDPMYEGYFVAPRIELYRRRR